MKDISLESILIFFSWVLSLFSMLGSLFFSEVMSFPPCVLCWYQRIAMYPLVLILGIGIFESPRTTIKFSLPFVFIGWTVSLYHNLLHYNIIPESASPCQIGVSCSTVYINWFGFLTIPMLSFISFSILLLLLIILFKRVCCEKKVDNCC